MSPFPNSPDGFTPEMLDVLDRAFSETWRELQLRRSLAATAANKQVTLAAIAKSISELAATGVREPERLKRHALHAAERSRPRPRPILHLPD